MDAAKRLATLNRIRKLSRLMDTSIRIPLTGFHIGIDPIIGLVPGAGDLISTAFSLHHISSHPLRHSTPRFNQNDF